MEESFQARVDKGGKVHWNRPQDAAALFRALAGQRVTITITPGRRTLSQNARCHAIFGEFSRRSGYSPAVCKEYCKQRYIDDGRGTSDLNMEESSDFAIYCESMVAEFFG